MIPDQNLPYENSQIPATKYSDEKTWDAMFEKAVHTEKGEHPDLVPYWCLTDGDEAKVKIKGRLTITLQYIFL